MVYGSYTAPGKLRLCNALCQQQTWQNWLRTGRQTAQQAQARYLRCSVDLCTTADSALWQPWM